MTGSMDRITVRFPDELFEEMDEVVESGEFPNHTELIRQAVSEFLTDEEAEQEAAASTNPDEI